MTASEFLEIFIKGEVRYSSNSELWAVLFKELPVPIFEQLSVLCAKRITSQMKSWKAVLAGVAPA